jgi:RNA polymerase sigma-70 factor (ECF subfamily)
MRNTTSTLDVDELLAQTAWLRRLARALVADEAAAEDLVQDTFVVAARHRPGGRPLGPWLVRVMRNLARMQWRGATRRRGREVRAAGDASTEASPDELLARLETQRLVTRLVVELGAPYRVVVLLHYVEGLSSESIAQRLGIASGTVRWRLKQALDQLRDRLDEESGGQRALWMVPAVRLSHGPSAAGTTPAAKVALGAIAMKKIAFALALVILLLTAGVALWWPEDPVRQATARPVAAARGASRARPTRPVDPDPLPRWRVQAGAPARRIAGRVVAGGAPLAGATVRLLASDRFSVPAAALAERVTGADGRFDLGIHPASAYAVAATAAGRAPTAARFHLGDPELRPAAHSLVIDMGPCDASVAGAVTDVSGPIAGAELRVEGRAARTGDGPMSLAAVADEAGRFAICVPPARAFVRVDADGYAAATLSFGHVGRLERDIMLVPEARVSGRVVGPGGDPVAGARVLAAPIRPRASTAEADLSPHAAVSDDDGRFELAALAPGSYDLHAVAERATAAYPVSLVLQAGSAEDVLIELAPTQRLRGRVTAGGAPVAGAQVEVSWDTPSTAAPVYTQADGSFVLDGVPRGPIGIAVEDHVVVAPHSIEVGDRDLEVAIEVSRMAGVRGRVTRAGVPVSDARVGFGEYQTVLTDVEGRYHIEGLLAGSGTVWAESTGLGAFTDGRVVTVAAGTTLEVDLALDLAGEVSGDVVDRAGAPVAGAYLRLALVGGQDWSECMTGERGRFRCRSLRGGGDYLAAVYPSPTAATPFAAAGRPHPPIRVPDGTARVTGVRLLIEHDRLVIRGRVIDPDGAPVVDARVVAEGRDPALIAGRPSLPAARSDMDGRFAVADLAPGAYSVRARSALGDAVVADVVAGAADALVIIEPFGYIDGTLTGFDRWLKVTARSLDISRHGVEVGQVRGPAGQQTFRIAALPAGDYYVTAQGRRDGVELDASAAQVRSGQTARLELVNRGTAVIRGVVLEHGSARPVPGMFCNATASLDGARTNNMVLSQPGDPGRITDAAGRFEISPAPAGAGVRVECWSHDDHLSHAFLDRAIPRGGAADLVLRAVRRSAIQVDTGHVYEPWVLPPRVWRVDPDGPAAAAGLQPGDRLLAVEGDPVDDLAPDGVNALVQNHLADGACVLAVSRGQSRREITLRRR